jgi:hypothetical protein
MDSTGAAGSASRRTVLVIYHIPTNIISERAERKREDRRQEMTFRLCSLCPPSSARPCLQR